MAGPPGDTEAVLRLRGLRKSFGDLVAVEDLTLDVFRGEVFGLLGPNGAGKTTTISMVCGLLEADGGEILVGGLPLRTRFRECRRRLGLCPQDLAIWERLTCQEQLEFVGRLYDLPAGEARRRALELLDILGLSDRRRTLAGTLSGGMKRRLNLALGLVHDPEIVILDEPQAGLDPQSRILVREYIRTLASRRTVVLTTHDMAEADQLSDRVGILDHGRLLVLDTPRGLKERVGTGDVLELRLDGARPEDVEGLRRGLPAGIGPPAHADGVLRFAGLDVHRDLPAVLEETRRAGVGIRDLTIRQATLEDVFIALTGRGLRE